MNEYTCIELFAGGGGLSLGFEQAGIKNVGLIENNKWACETLRHNRPSWNVIEEDIIKVTKNGIRQYIGNQKIDIVTGGYPCQPFTTIGKRLGLEDIRGTMFYYYAKVLEEIKPKVFVAENVKGLVNHDKGRTLKTMIDVFSDIGYNVQYKVLNAIDYEVAQKRERVFIVGTRKDLKDNYTYPEPIEKTLLLKDVLSNVPFSEGAEYKDKEKELFKLIPQGGCWINLDDDIAKEHMGKAYLAGGGKRGYLRRMSMNEPSLTLTCSPIQKQLQRCHPSEIRPFTVREYARIQSFPDEWIFKGSMRQQYMQIGNAVPCNLAKHIGFSVINYLNNLD